MAQLLQAMEQQRNSSSQSSYDGGPSHGFQAPSLPTDASLLQLLEHACSNLAKLTSNTMQLFASDISNVLQQYRRCDGPGKAEWQHQIAELDGALEVLLQETRKFDAVYQQELSVWVQTARDDQQNKPCTSTDSTAMAADGRPAAVADGIGQAAQRIVTAFQAVKDVLEGVGSIQTQYQSLQDVPVAALQGQHLMHSEDTRRFNKAAAVLRPTAT
eukprot:gene11765-11910_t